MTAPFPTTKQAIGRGILLRCPNCGQGRLYKSYLKLTEECSHCQTSFVGITADDGPAWLSILIIGHVIAPIIIEQFRHPFLPDWALTPFLLILVCVLVAVILPRSKGIFVAILWRIREREKKG
jgi:uncharacterized protein (DUF983 family)